MLTKDFPPPRAVPFCTEIKSLGGVDFNLTIPVYDVRIPEESLFVKVNVNGNDRILWSSERVDYMFGIESSTPMSLQGYTDYRVCGWEELAKVAHGIRAEVMKASVAYQEACGHLARKGNGGSCVYRISYATVSNYGWSIHAVRGDYVVRSFS